MGIENASLKTKDDVSRRFSSSCSPSSLLDWRQKLTIKIFHPSPPPPLGFYFRLGLRDKIFSPWTQADLGSRMFDGQSLTLQELSWDRLDFLCFRFLSQGAAKLPGLAKMTTKVKGLLRGLRYISQIFDEKEQEMQIGLPTDVKHVAHIGWDGPSESAPSWMNEFASPTEALSGTSNSKEVKNLSTDSTLEDQTEKPKHSSRRSSGSASSLLNSPDRRSSDSSKHSRHQASSITGSPLNSPSDAPKSSRRHRSSNKSMDSPREESSGSSRTSRRHKTSSLGAESPIQDQPTIPKHSRGRKSKGSSGSGSSKSKEKNSSHEALPFPDPGPGGSESMHGRNNTASQLSSVLEAYEEER